MAKAADVDGEVVDDSNVYGKTTSFTELDGGTLGSVNLL